MAAPYGRTLMLLKMARKQLAEMAPTPITDVALRGISEAIMAIELGVPAE